MRKIDIFGMSLLLETMKAAQGEHPKAKVIYDVERGDIVITYPLPKDFAPMTQRPTYHSIGADGNCNQGCC